MLEEAKGVEDLIAVTPIPGAGTHLVEHKREALLGVIVRGPDVIDSGERGIRSAAAVELGEEGFEPVGLLVVDGDGEL